MLCSQSEKKWFPSCLIEHEGHTLGVSKLFSELSFLRPVHVFKTLRFLSLGYITDFQTSSSCYYFCDSGNSTEIGRKIFSRVCLLSEYLLKKIQIFCSAVSISVIFNLSSCRRQFVQFLCDETSLGVNCAFVRQIHCDDANERLIFVRCELGLHSDVNAKLRLRLVGIFALVRKDLKAV